jgi:serine phosphatase RsbU (regulator of sigma subunit)
LKNITKNILRLVFAMVLIAINCRLLTAQNKNLDSLLIVFKKDKSIPQNPSAKDTNKVILLNTLAWEYRSENIDSAILFSKQALHLSEKIIIGENTDGWQIGIGQANQELGTFYLRNSDYSLALEYYYKALNVWEAEEKKANENPSTKESKTLILTRKSSVIGNIGIVYEDQGEYPKALDYYFKALKMDEALGNKAGVSRHLGNIGIVYDYQGEHKKAIDYYSKALILDEELGDKKGAAADLGNIGNLYKDLGNYQMALDCDFKALKIDEELGNKNGEAKRLGNIGTVYDDLGKQASTKALKDDYFSKALDYYFRSLKIREKLGAKKMIAICLSNIGFLYTSTKNYTASEKYLLRSLALSDSIGELYGVMDANQHLSDLYEQMGQPAKALHHYKMAVAAKDTLFNEDKNNEITRKSMSFEFEKKEASSKAEQEKKDAVVASEKKKQKLILLLVSCVLVLAFVFAGFVFRSLRLTRKQKHIIEIQKNEVWRQKELVEEQQKEIIDSINYAKRIQQAMLPSNNYIFNELKIVNAEHFILFKPKAIVSGDFYWFYKNESCLYYITADCTGHGVPGGFMSMLGINLLNEIVIERNITNPGDILNKLREEIIKSLKTDDGYTKDGMDAIFCKIDFDKQTLEYAAANNAFYIIRKNVLIEQKAQKMPVGFMENADPFTTKTICLEKGDIIYTYTDGYADQFGGEKGKKFMYKKFKNLLLENYTLPFDKQEEALNNTFNDWKRNLEQVDDVCIIGIKI